MKTRHSVVSACAALYLSTLGTALAGIPVGSISGTKFEDVNANGIRDMGIDAPFEGVIIELRDDQGNVIDTTTTDTSGNYSFDFLNPGTYVVAEDLGSVPIPSEVAPTTPTEQTVQVGIDGNPVVDFGNTILGSIHGFKFLDSDGDGILDLNEGGLGGVVFELTGVDGLGNSVGATTTTDADGLFAFTDLFAGEYSIQELIPGGFDLTTSPNQRPFELSSGQELVYQDGAAMLPPDSLRVEVNVGDELIWGNAPAPDIPVPAPAILALLGIGLIGMGYAKKRARA